MMTKKIFVLWGQFLLVNLFVVSSYCQTSNDSDTQGIKNLYVESFINLKELLVSGQDFSKAVYYTEQAFGTPLISFSSFNLITNDFAKYILNYKSRLHLTKYNQPDSNDYKLNCLIFKTLFDSLDIVSRLDTTIKLKSISYSYQHEDPLAKEDWTNMFVTKLLATRKGNCHSLSYLYKIVADKIGAKCWLALAPNHIYIKNFSQYFGWYNTELTSRSFPDDAWIMTTSYVHPNAVRSGLYMDTLSNQQAIALCVHDLAKGYENQTHNYYDGFILQCCDLVLQYHPLNPMTLLLKAETLRKVYDQQLKEKNTNAAETYKKMEAVYARLAKLYYREMPEEMYLKWLENARNYSNKMIK